MAVKKTKVTDKWKLKRWFTVLAPRIFDGREICEVITADEKSLQNRIVKVNLSELIGSSSQTAMFTTLNFRITDVEGSNARTKLIGYEITPSYIRTFARRGKDLIHIVVDGKTKDGMGVRVKVVTVTGAKASRNTRRNLRAAITDEIGKSIAGCGYDELMQDMIYGRLTSRLFNRLKQITAIKRIEIRKAELEEIFR